MKINDNEWNNVKYIIIFFSYYLKLVPLDYKKARNMQKIGTIVIENN